MSHCAISQRLIFERKHFIRDRWLVRIIAFIILESGDNSGVDGDSALRNLTSDERFDLLLVDNELPGVSGLDLVKRTRKMTHRRRTPIVMLSGNDCETEAWRAGVDAFLKKPQQVKDLPTTISRLLKVDMKQG